MSIYEIAVLAFGMLLMGATCYYVGYVEGRRRTPPKVLYGVRVMKAELQPDLSRRERRAKARQR